MHVRFSELTEAVDGAAVEEEEIGAGGRHLLHPDEVPHEEVEQLGEEQGPPFLPESLAPDRPDHLGARFPRDQQFRDHLRRVLQVGRQHHGARATGVVQSAGNRGVRTVVAGETHAAHPRVAGGQFGDDLERLIRRVVIDDDPLPGSSQFLHDRRDAVVEHREILRLAVGGRHE